MWPCNIRGLPSSPNFPNLGPTVYAPIRATVPPRAWTTPLPATSCQKTERGLKKQLSIGVNQYISLVNLVPRAFLHREEGGLTVGSPSARRRKALATRLLFCMYAQIVSPIDDLHSRDQRPYWFLKAKGKICIKMEFNYSVVVLFHQNGHRFFLSAFQYGRHDVMWKRSVQTTWWDSGD